MSKLVCQISIRQFGSVRYGWRGGGRSGLLLNCRWITKQIDAALLTFLNIAQNIRCLHDIICCQQTLVENEIWTSNINVIVIRVVFISRCIIFSDVNNCAGFLNKAIRFLLHIFLFSARKYIYITTVWRITQLIFKDPMVASQNLQNSLNQF